MVLWALGYPDQALERSHEALSLAQKLSRPFSQAFARSWFAWIHQFRREAQATQEQAEAATTLATAQGFALWLAWGTIYRGWALAIQGQEEAGIAQIHQGLAAYRATGAEVCQPYFLGLLAEAYGGTGQVEEGFRVLAEALALVDKNEERWCEAELHRLNGELLLQLSSDNAAEVESSFHKAITIAQSQQAKSWELRAATSLAKLWQSQDKYKEAYDLLAPVYDWFTEGFDTADLKDAKQLLEGLAN